MGMGGSGRRGFRASARRGVLVSSIACGFTYGGRAA